MALAVSASDRGAAAAGGGFAGADGTGGGDAVHFGHLNVHQHDVPLAPLPGLDRLAAVNGDHRGDAGLAEDRLEHLLVDLVVLGGEDPQGGIHRHVRRRRD